MKFKDIPQIPQTNYRIQVPLSSLKYTLERYRERQEKAGFNFVLMPDFQRGHIWTTQQQIKYVEWLLMGGNSGLDIYFNHPGWNTDYKGDMVCLDGLQRVTACLEFMNNEFPAFGYLYKEFEGQLGHSIPALYFNVLSLKTRKEILKWYLIFNSGGTVHSTMELNRVSTLLAKELDNE